MAGISYIIYGGSLLANIDIGTVAPVAAMETGRSTHKFTYLFVPLAILHQPFSHIIHCHE
jgi:hypothetical protein